MPFEISNICNKISNKTNKIFDVCLNEKSNLAYQLSELVFKI